MSTESEDTGKLVDFLLELEKAQKGERKYVVEIWSTMRGRWENTPKTGPFNTIRTYRVKYASQVWWMNMYPRPLYAVVHDTKENADESATGDRIKCVKVVEDLS